MIAKLKEIKPVDWIILAGVLIALVVGFLTFTHVRQTAGKQIEATSKIGFQVFLRGVTITSQELPMKKGEKTFLTIRNVPYSDLDIIDVVADTKKVILPNARGKEQFTVLPDVSQAASFDVLVTVADTAKITKDGAVVGGNKIKIGIPVTIEGKNYRFNGVISDVQIINENSQNETKDNVKKTPDSIT